MSYQGEYIPGSTRQLPWFLQDDERVADTLTETVTDIERRQASITLGHQRHARIYAGYCPPAIQGRSGAGSNTRPPVAATKWVVRNVCDTATALIGKFRPKSTFVTDGADWKIQRQAEDLDRFMVGAYETGKVYPTATRVFHDATVFGTGAWKLVPKGDEDKWHVAAERVLPSNLIVDEEECPEHLEPMNMYHRTVVSVEAVIRKYASGDSQKALKLREKIRAAAGRSWPNLSVTATQVVLIEATHVNPDDASANKRVLVVGDALLKSEDWPHPWHPYVVLHWVTPLSGFYGDGIAYRQYGLQERVNYMYRWVNRVHDLFATPVAWVPPSGGPPTLQMSNEIGAIITCHKPPVFQTRSMISHEVYAWIDRLVQGGYEDEGISQATGGGMLPPGIESAPAQREYSFKESNRFAPVSQRWEYAIAVETALKMTAMYRRRAQTHEAPVSRWADRTLMHTIEWPDLDEMSYIIRPEASSLEVLSPSSRIQAAIELAQTQWLLPGEGRDLIAHPDLKRRDDLDNAPKRYADLVLRKLFHGEFVEIDEYADLKVIDKTVRAGRLLAKERSAPPAIVDNCSDYLDRLSTKIQQAEAAAAAQAQAGAGTMAPTGPLTTGNNPGLPPSHE